MTEAEIKALVDRSASEAAKHAVKEMLLTMGIDTEDVLEVQRDMQHLRAWRQSIQTVKRQSLVVAVGIIVTGAIGALWLALKGPPV